MICRKVIKMSDEILYHITADFIQADAPVSLEQIKEVVDEWSSDPATYWGDGGWSFSVEDMDSQLRIYAERVSSENLTPGPDFIMISRDAGYVVIGVEVEDEEPEVDDEPEPDFSDGPEYRLGYEDDPDPDMSDPDEPIDFPAP